MTAAPSRGTALRWALRRRCPACGTRLFRGWFRMVPACPGCGLLTDRGEPDYFLGAVLVNLIAAELVPVALVLALIVTTWPDPPWTLVQWAALGLAALAPIVGYPFSKTLWLFADVQIRGPVRVRRHDPADPPRPR